MEEKGRREGGGKGGAGGGGGNCFIRERGKEKVVLIFHFPKYCVGMCFSEDQYNDQAEYGTNGQLSELEKIPVICHLPSPSHSTLLPLPTLR